MELEFQRANHVVDLVQRIEKIKDPHVREKMREAISPGAPAFRPADALGDNILHQTSAPKSVNDISGQR